LIAKLHVDRAARIVRSGGVVAYPTEGVWGIGCLPLDADAVARVIAIKRRMPDKGLLLIAADLDQLAPFVDLPGGPIRGQILASWPGPVTWVLPAKPGVPHWLTGGRDTCGVRVTDHQGARALCTRVGSALISTSANRSGRPSLRRLLAVRRELGRDVDYVLPGALGTLQRPTTIRDGRTGQVLRPGDDPVTSTLR
jgi:L-threonylcarbamoyladenylate synthase